MSWRSATFTAMVNLVWVQLTGSLVRDNRGTPLYFISQIQDITQRKAAHDALAASEERFRVAFADAPIGMAIVGPDQVVQRVNRAYCALLGYAESELIGTNLMEITHPDDRAANTDLIARALAGQLRTYQLEKRYLRQDGQVVWASLSASLVRRDDGAPWYFLSQIQDITARKEAKLLVTERRRLTEELRASETKFRALVEQLPAAVYLLAADESLTPIYASSYLEVLTGYPPHEVLDSVRWLELVHPEDRDRAAAEDARCATSGEAFRLDYRFVRRNGGVIWVRDECVPMRDGAGVVIGWLGVMMDITDRVTADEVRGRLAAIVESADDAVISSNLDGIITSWNRGAEKLYGYRAEEIVGQPIAVMLPEDFEDPLLAGRFALVAAGISSEPFETVRRRRDGSTVDVTIVLSPIRDRAGAVIGLSAITRDITARKRLEGELRAALREAQAANEAKSHFLAMMSHELRTPLQAVLGYAEYLLADPEGALRADQRDDLAYIHQGGQRMLTLVSQLLDLSRIEAGRFELDREPVDLPPIVEQVRQDLAPQAQQKRLTLQIDLPPALPPVLGDDERIRQILLNLTGNAVKFTERGVVAITSQVTEREVAITVRDTGSGIAPDALPHIFEAFRQGDRRLTRRHGGAGLGLAIAQKLAELMDGQITVESEPGVGSTFTLHLPR